MVVHLHRRPPRELGQTGRFGPHDLLERGLYRQWFIRYRLDQELIECRRYGVPLSVVILSPMLIAGEANPEERVSAGAMAARAAARTSDLIGWLDGDDILVVLPHSDLTGAHAAVARWQEHMVREPAAFRPVRWLASSLEDHGDFETGSEFIAAAMHRFRGLD